MELLLPSFVFCELQMEKYLFVWKSTFSFMQMHLFHLISDLVILGTEFIFWEHVISLSTLQNEDIWEPQIWISRVDHVAVVHR